MLGLLFAGFLFMNLSFALEVNLDSDANVYDSAVLALKIQKEREFLEREGIRKAVERPKSVCYDELGCFESDGLFKHVKLLPEPPETVNTKFLLYTRKNWITPQFLDYKKPETILNSNINPEAPIKFITHGFGGKNNISWVWNMKTAFLEKEDLNVVAIDWSLGARIPYYYQATVNTQLVGAQAAVLFFAIKDHFGIQEKDLHVIGFSLGAHVSGFVGKKMLELRETKPGRITGLDPASPLFEEYGPEVHLSKDDADFVDIVHTNADSVYFGGVGIEKPIGHVDYYPNGGKRQPGCKSTLSGLLKDIFKNERERVCNHERAVHLFTDTIRNDGPCEFKSFKCESYEDFQLGNCLSCEEQCGAMGYNSRGSGIYYLMTNPGEPFCAGHAKLKVKFPSEIKKSYGSLILTIVAKTGQKRNITITDSDDQKLSPGEEKVRAVTITDLFSQMDYMQVLYQRYNGFFTKGQETFGLESVTIEDSDGNLLFRSCNDPAITLKDKEYYTLKETDKSC